MLALLATGAAVPVRTPSVSAAADAAQDLARLNRQLDGDQAKLDELNDRVERADGEVDVLNRKLVEDQRSEADLRRQVSAVARMEYQRPALTLSTILDARSLDQLLSNIAQARLVARRQQNLASQAVQLRKRDEQVRDELSAKAAEVKKARDEAAQVAARTLALRNAASDEVLKARAQTVADQASATQGIKPAASAPPPGAISEAPGPNHFAYGYCTWYVANRRYVPWLGNAIEWWANARAYGYAEGQSPQVGAIMVTRESGYGHVAYVESVNGDGTWTVSEMNFVAWNVVSRRTLRPGQAPVVGFIYGKA
jgi:surface antigen